MSDPSDAPRRPDVPLSILDLAAVGPGESIGESFAGSVRLAQAAERLGYERIWYAEHHNIRSIASSATSVLIAHIAAHTETIRLGAGGIMLPNHSPLVIAEQFGTLAELHPGRIDLGLGRAPGSDTAAMRALRRDELSSERFPQDVVELQKWLGENSPVSGVIAIPGKGTNVPLYILGSSLFGAQLAAVLGLPYAFASHFAPTALFDALEIYRENFKPSEQLAEPYAMAGIGVIAAADKESAEKQLEITRRVRVKSLFKSNSGGKMSEEEVDEVLGSYRAKVVDEMMTYTGVGTGEEAAAYLADFQAKTGVQELITVHYADSVENRVRSVEILAEAAGLGEPAAAATA
jgi:luciferase family oxidoreductase group 1